MYPSLRKARGKALGQQEWKPELSSHGFLAAGTPPSTEARAEES